MNTNSSSIDLKKEFQKRGPWITQFNINGEIYGGYYSISEMMISIEEFNDHFPDVRTILDLGILEGARTYQLAKNHLYILGIEGREENLKKARFVRDILGIKNVDLLQANLENIRLSMFGKFDAVFCSGILYHLPRPWELIKKISEVTSNLFLITHYAEDYKADTTINGFKGMWTQEGGLNDPLSGLSSSSFWFTLQSLQDILKSFGFVNIEIVKKEIVNTNPMVHVACGKK